MTNATITFTNHNTGDTFTATSASCAGGGSFDTSIATGGKYVKGTGTGTVTFIDSTIAWNPTNDTLTFTLGTLNSGSTNVNANVTAGDPGYTANGNATDISGVAVSTAPFTSGTSSGF